MREILTAGAEKMGIALPETACMQFERYLQLLEEGNQRANLTAVTGEEAVTRHFLDSLSLLTVYDFAGKRVIDVGTGAGFPGVPVKLAIPSVKLTLLDSLDKRVEFLRGLSGELKLTDTECIHARAEEAALKPEYRESFDAATSRAVARLNVLAELCLPFVKVNGVFLAMKADEAEEEIKEAEKAIKLLGGTLENCIKYEAGGIARTIVVIRKRTAAPKEYPRRFAKIKKEPLQ